MSNDKPQGESNGKAEVVVEATVIRKDGTREELGEISRKKL